MAFPNDPLPVVVEINTGSWVDITDDVLVRDKITITRGFPDEGSAPEPSRCSLTLKNNNGKYSPRNPSSTHYGKIGRNTPLRVWLRMATGAADGESSLSVAT